MSWSPTNPNGLYFNGLKGPFEITFWGNQYALTVICMLTKHTICILLPYRSADTVVNAYLKDVKCRFGGSWKTLSHNGGEFKNSLFLEVALQLDIKHIYSSPYRPQANGRIEAPHIFLKKFYQEIQSKELSWMGQSNQQFSTIYSFFPNIKSQTGAFTWKGCVYPYSGKAITTQVKIPR